VGARAPAYQSRKKHHDTLSRFVHWIANSNGLRAHPYRVRLALQQGMRAPSRFPIKAAAVFVAIGLAFSRATPAAAQPRAIDAQRSTITIHVFKSGLFRAFADNHLIQGPVAAGVIDDSAAPRSIS
jgi:hypothetical protein